MSNFPYLLKLSWREGQRQRGQLLLFMSSIILGIAALVAINSFNYNLLGDIDNQTASLIGADLKLSSNKPFQGEVREILGSLEGETAEQWDMMTMAYFPSKDKGQFVRLRGTETGFPFYGEVHSIPTKSANTYIDEGSALVDEGLMETLKLEVGDSIKLGEITFVISGALSSSDAGSGMASSFAPGVRIGLSFLNETNLVREGSLVNFSLFKKADTKSVHAWLSSYDEKITSLNVSTESVQDRKEQMGEAFSYLNQFLNLVALIALVLGCIGVASSIFIYIKRKEPTIAILRCLGMESKQVSFVFFTQIFIWGVISVIGGALLGSAIQVVLPKLFSEVLPYKVDFSISWRAIIEGISIGTVVTALFCLMPLTSIKSVSAIQALRPSYNAPAKKNGWSIWIISFLVVLSIWLYLFYVSKDVQISTYFIIGLLFSFAVLYLFSQLFTKLIKRFFPRNIGFVWRQGIASLFRPQNRTSLLMMSIGMGVAIIGVLIIVQSLLLHNVESMGSGKQPNVVLYGVESDQLKNVEEVTDSLNMPIIQSVPVVTAELVGWKGKLKSEWRKDSSRNQEEWVMRRETRISYRNYLEDNEKLMDGVFPKPFEGDSIFISLASNYVEALDVKLGDEIVFNIQGVRMTTYLGSVREIDFANLQARFFILFPDGVLENAPQFHVLISKTQGNVETAKYRNLIAARFPNVSVIDLSSILKAVSDILNKVTYVIKFMAGFSILTGFLVLFSAMLLSKFQRIKEGVLLRTLGASRKEILLINATEYAFIGFFAAFIGILVSLLLAYLLSTFQFGLEFNVNLLSLAFVWFGVVAATTIIGVISGLDIVKYSPLKVLRSIH